MAELFNIQLESDLSEFDSTTTDGGNLSQETPGLAGTVGRMEALINDTNSMYGMKSESAPTGTNEIRFRFYYDPNGLTMASEDDFQLVAYMDGSWNGVVAVHTDDWQGQQNIAINVYNEAGWFAGGSVAISDAEHYVEVHVERESSDSAADGQVTMWVDGAQEYIRSDIDNYARFANCTQFQIGAHNIDSGTSGTIYLDEILANDDGSEIGPVAADSASVSPSVSPSLSPSASESVSESASISPSASVSASVSASASLSVSPSVSVSVSPSVSPSVSLSISPSASPSPAVSGEVTWGHDTGVAEANVLDFAGNWSGTGSIISSGDDEQICLDVGEYMESDIVDTGAFLVTLFQNLYDGTGDDVTLRYRHGATPAACVAAAWNNYTVPFVSAGYVQVRLEAT